MAKKSSFFARLFKQTLILAPMLFSFFSNLISLAEHEARLAGKNIMITFLLTFMSAILFTTIWLALLAMLGLFLISLGWHYLLTISLLIVLNVLVLTIILFKIKQLKKNLFFPKTLKKLHYKKS